MNTKINLSAKFAIVSIIIVFGLLGSFMPMNSASAMTVVKECNRATLTTTVYPEGEATYAWFEWGPGNNFSANETLPHKGPFYSTQGFSEVIPNLSENTDYSTRAVIWNSNDGTIYSNVVYFRTNTCTPPPPTSPLSCSGPTSVTAGTTATFSASGGTSPYNWTEGPSNSHTGSTWNLSIPSWYSGQKIVQLRDTNGGYDTCTFTVNPPTPVQACTLNISYNPTVVPYGGSLTVSYSGTNVDNSSVEYNFDNGGWGTVSPFPDSKVQSNLTSIGFHSIILRGQNSAGTTCYSNSASYTVNPPANTTATIQGYKVKMPGNNSAPNPPANETVSVSGGPSSSANPYYLYVTSGNTYTVSVTSPGTGWTIQSSLCIDNTNCHGTPNGTGSTRSVTIPSGSGHYADLWWHFTPPPTIQTCQDPNANNYGGPLPCTYNQATPTGTLNISPSSCIINAGQSTCTVTGATWNTNNATSPAVVDRNTGITLSNSANRNTPMTVWVTYPQTIFDLKNSGTILDTKTATASCASGTSWNNSVCAQNINPPTSCANGSSLTQAEFYNAYNAGKIILNEITLSNGTATFQVINNTGCTASLSLASYKEYDYYLANQVLYDRTPLTNIGSGSLSVSYPTSCRTQIDAFYGPAPTNLVDTVPTPYSYPNYPWNIKYTHTPGAFCTNNQTLAPTVNLTADNTNVNYGSPTTLRWTTGNNPTSCTASDGWSGSKSISGGSQSTGNLYSPTTFKITCSNSAGSDSAQVTVNVGSQINPTGTLTISPSSCIIGAGQRTCTTNATWNTNNATSPAVVDRNTGNTLSTLANQYSPFTVWVAYPQTVFDLKNSGSILDTKVATSSCASGTSWNGAICVGNYVPQDPEVTLNASDSNVDYGDPVYLTWNSDNATSCTGTSTPSNAQWNGSKSLNNNSGFRINSLTASTTFKIICYGANGRQANDTATVTVSRQLGEPTVSLSAAQTQVSSGGSTTLTWSTTNSPTSCVASGGWSGNKNTAGGSQSTGSLYSTTTFSITCSNNAGSDTAQATVTVTQLPPQTPTVDLTASPSSLNQPGTSTLSWVSQYTSSCYTSSWGGGDTRTSGYKQVYVGSTTSYTVTCYATSNGQPISDTATVSVNNDNNNDNVTVDLRADDTRIDSGDTTRVRWTSENADYCIPSGGTNDWKDEDIDTDGSFRVEDLTSDKTFRITCYNNDDSADDSVTIRVDDSDNNNGDGPDVDTKSATNVQTTSATLNGRVDGNGRSTRAWFEYGTNTNLGYTTDDKSYGSGVSNYNKTISGLIPNTTYYFRAVAENSEDTVYGNILSFYTRNDYVNPPVQNQPTVVVSADSTNISYGSATTVRWYTTNATSCFASGGSIGWAGAKSIGPASFYTGSLTSSKTYVITCTNNYGTSTDSVTVGVRGQVLGTSTIRQPLTSLVLITSSVDRNQPIVPTLDNTRPHPGDEINYTVTYQNIGTGSVTNLVLRLDLPYEVSYMFSNPNNPIMNGNTLIFNLGTLKANGQGTVTVRVRVRDNVAPGTMLNFPAILSYVDPSGYPQSVTANVSAQVWSEPYVAPTITEDKTSDLGASVFAAGFLPTNLFGWLLLFILVLILVLLAKYLFGGEQPWSKKTTTTITH